MFSNKELKKNEKFWVGLQKNYIKNKRFIIKYTELRSMIIINRKKYKKRVLENHN